MPICGKGICIGFSKDLTILVYLIFYQAKV